METSILADGQGGITWTKGKKRSCDSLVDPVNRVIMFRGGAPIKKFILDASDAKLASIASHVDVWIRAAMFRGLQELELFSGWPGALALPLSLWKHEQLTKLTLSLSERVRKPQKIKYVESARLPRLRSLKFKGMALTAEFINQIFTSSPFLEDVTLDNCYWTGGIRHLCSKSLRRLCLFNHEDKHEVNTIIDAPSLIYFNYSGELRVDYTIENLNSLSKADIILDCDYFNSQAVGKFLAGIDMAKDVSLFGFRLEWLKNEDVNDPFDELSIFGNLRKLELGYMLQVEWDMLLDLLYSRPLLEALVFEEIDCESILPEEELDRFPPNLKVIELIFFSGEQHEMDFIEYFLLNAELEKLILHKSKAMTVEEELRISEQLMKMKSNSNSQHCSIQLKKLEERNEFAGSVDRAE